MRLLGGSWHPASISAWWFLRNVLASAEQVVQHIIRAYSEPKLAAEEIPSTAKVPGSLVRVQLHPPR